MDEKQSPAWQRGLARGQGARQVALFRTPRRDRCRQTATRNTQTMVCIVAPYLLPHKRKEGYGTGTATTFQPSR